MAAGSEKKLEEADMSRVSGIPGTRFVGRIVYIVGASSTSQSIARFLLRAGHRVFMSDADVNRALESATAELGGELAFSRGRHEHAFVARADVVVLSPEIAQDDEIVRFARSRGKRILTTVQFIASGRRAMPIQRLDGRGAPAGTPRGATKPAAVTQSTPISTVR